MRLAITLGLAGLSLLAAPALAQNRTISSRGSGSLHLPNTPAIPLYQVTFDQSGRTLTLAFMGKGRAVPWTFKGRITGNPSGSDLAVEVTGGLNDIATRGSGRIVLSGSRLASLDLRGTARQGPFEIDFRGEGSGGDWAGGGETGARPINESATGSGTYEMSGRRANLNEMRIRLHGDGRAELSFDGDRGDVEGKGTWRRGSNGRAEINLTEWNGRRTSGTGAVTYRGRAIERISLNIPVQNARVEFYPARAESGDNWGGNNNSARPVNTSFVGTGAFRERGRTYQLDEARVRLRDDGEAELRFNGERQTGGRGRWTPGGNYATLTIQEWDGRSTSGSGNVAFAGNQPQQVTLTLQGGRSITFRSAPQIQPR
jgi:hypothetical protein